MKEITNYNRTVQYLSKVFKYINQEYFIGALDIPTITVQSTAGAYGHVTTSKVWKNERGEASYELNISADYLDRPIENIVATLIHESCHLYAMHTGIKDTSNRGVYHNKNFKRLAEERGLIISKHEKYGWTITEPSERTIDFCIQYNLKDIKVSRDTGFFHTGIGIGKGSDGTTDKPTAKKGNSQKWVCPCCRTIIRSTKKVHVICGECGETFIRA